MKYLPHLTFAEIVDETREAAAGSAWARAKRASRLRRVAARSGHRRAARAFAGIKADAILLVARLVPEQVEVTVDRDYHVGFFSIRLDRQGKLHLPPGTMVSADT